MLIKPGEEFSVDRVVEKALRQDIGPDPTLAMNRQDYKYVDEKNQSFPIWEYKKKYRDRDPVLNAEAYFYDYNQIQRRQRQFDFDCKLFDSSISIICCRGKASDFYQPSTEQEPAETQIHEKD